MELGPPGDWVFKGEGNANVVFGYTGSRSDLVGRVLKVRKSVLRASSADKAAQQELEHEVWAPVLGRHHASPLARELLYTEQCLLPLLGREYVPSQVPIQVSPNFLGQLHSLSGTGNPGSCHLLTATSQQTAILMPDVTLLADQPPQYLPPAAGPDNECAASLATGSTQPVDIDPVLPHRASPVLCVEIKPKCGSLTACPTIHPDNHFKYTRSRYQLHQLLKVAEGKLAAASSYDPLDLFSNQPQRMLAALRALFAHPQNNLRLFLDGAPVGLQEGLSKWAGATLLLDAATVGDAAAAGTEAAGAAMVAGLEGLLEVLVQILMLEGVLNRLLRAQQQCEVDIEGIFALYCKLLSGPSTAQPASTEERSSSLGSPQLLAPHEGVQQVLSLPTDQAYSLLRRYVVAATAKDCALMISLRPLASAAEGRQLQQRGGKVICSTSQALKSTMEGCTHAEVPEDAASSEDERWYQYQVAFVDLDMKALAKIPQHFELDQRIVKAAREQQQASSSCVDG